GDSVPLPTVVARLRARSSLPPPRGIAPAKRSVSVRNCGDPIAADPPGGRGGWGLGKPDRTVWPTARLSVAGTPVPTYDHGFPKAPPTPPALSAVPKVGSTTRVARFSWAAGSDCVPPTSYDTLA